MTNEAQDVTVETQSPEVEATTEESQEVANQDQSEESEAEEVEGAVEQEEAISIEERLERVVKEKEAQDKKIKRQKAAYSDMQKKYESVAQQAAQFKQANPEPELEQPKIDDYDTLDEFQAARDKFIEDKTKRTLEQEMLAKQQQQQMQQMQAQRNEIYEQSKKATLANRPDFVRAETEVNEFLVAAAKSVPAAIQDAIAEQLYDDPEMVGEVVYYFGANNGERIDELVEISKQSPRKAAISLYKLQQELRKAPQPKKKENLPKPASRVKATGSPKKDLMSGDVLKNLGLK